MSIEFTDEDMEYIENVSMSSSVKQSKKTKKNKRHWFTRLFIGVSVAITSLMMAVLFLVAISLSRVRGLIGDEMYEMLASGSEVKDSGLLDSPEYAWVSELRWLTEHGPAISVAVCIVAIVLILTLGIIDTTIRRKNNG